MTLKDLKTPRTVNARTPRTNSYKVAYEFTIDRLATVDVSPEGWATLWQVAYHLGNKARHTTREILGRN